MTSFSVEQNQAVPQLWQRLKTSGKAGFVVFFIGLALFLASCWFFWDQQKIYSPDAVNYTVNRSSVIFPDDQTLTRLTSFYGESQALDKEKERFRVLNKPVSDEVLMDAPKANIQGKIVGIITSNNNELNTVIIDVSGKQQSYSKGDRILNSYPVIKIFSDRVIIDEDGFYAALTLED